MMSLADEPTRCGFFARAGHGGKPGHHLHDLVERGAMFVGAGQKSLVAGNDQMRIFLAQLIGAEALLLELAVAEILQEHVGALEQPVHGLARLRPWQSPAPRCVFPG